MISALDAAIGKIVTTLKTTGQYNNTVIVFSSDSGSGNLNLMEFQNFEPTRTFIFKIRFPSKQLGQLNQKVKDKGSSHEVFFEMKLGSSRSL
jgi:arylsulfatase A-like enzyme